MGGRHANNGFGTAACNAAGIHANNGLGTAACNAAGIYANNGTGTTTWCTGLCNAAGPRGILCLGDTGSISFDVSTTATAGYGNGHSPTWRLLRYPFGCWLTSSCWRSGLQPVSAILRHWLCGDGRWTKRHPPIW